MKKLMNFAALLLVGAFLFTSCESEPSDPTESKPIVSLLSASEITVAPEATFTIDFTASKSADDSPLRSVTIRQDGANVPFARISVNGAAASSNPILLFGDDKDGLSWTADIVAQATVATSATYEIVITDEASQTQSISVTVTTEGTPPELSSPSPMNVTTFKDIKNLFRLTAEKGSGDLVSIEVTENDVLVDASRLFWQGISMPVANNPFALGDELKEGFVEEELYIMTPDSFGTFNYAVVITDEFGLTDRLNFEITTTGDPVDMLEGVLLNAGGPQGTGGLDLDNGASTDSDDVEAEIKDNGIDLNLPPDQNWLRTISPITENGVTMKYLKAGEGGLPEGFTFGDLQYKEDIPALYDNGIELTNGASDRVEIEDVFIVKRDDKYWVLEVIEIVTSPSDNTDSYKFDVKY